MAGSLDGKVALVAGASRGIGADIAKYLARAGAKVAVCARTEEVKDPRLPGTIHSVTQEIKDEGGVPYQVNFVKRVIGLPGDKVEFRDNHVYINDEILPEHRVIGDSPMNGKSRSTEAALETTEFEPREPGQKYDVFYSGSAIKGESQNPTYEFAGEGKPFNVPENSYFVMGDSRNQSLDSRYWGVVSRDLVIGRAMFVSWCCDRDASGGSMLGCLTSPRLSRIGKLIR